MSKIAYHRDSSEPCTVCGRPVFVSEVTGRYTAAARMYWFVSGICDRCQR